MKIDLPRSKGIAMKRYVQGVNVELECGHDAVIATSFFRLSFARAMAIYGETLWPRGMSCPQCGRVQQPVKYLGTCRLDT